MSPLPFNMLLPRELRGGIQFALGLLPIGLVFASFGLLWLFAMWLATQLGIPEGSPVRDHPNGWLWAAISLCALLCLTVAGYFLGWLLNAAIARYVLGWSRMQVDAVFLRCEIPQHWYRGRTGANEPMSANPKFGTEDAWGKLRRQGPWRFILFRGILTYGGILFLSIAVVPAFMGTRTTDLGYWLTHGLTFSFAGALFGGYVWYSSEKQYRQLKRERGNGP